MATRRPLAYAYFPTAGFISVLAPLDGVHGLEVRAVGCEGMFGPESEAAARTFELRSQFSDAGYAWQVRSAQLARFKAGHPALGDLLLRYHQVMMTQTARHVACCRFHSLQQRLARWLLCHRDRSLSDDLIVTHEGLARMMGARRAGITETTAQLCTRGLIGCGRGHIVVLNRTALAATCCSCYEADRQTYERVMGINGKRTPK